MKKIVLVLAILISCMIPAFAEDKENELKETGIRVDGGIGLSGSLFSTFLMVNPEIMYDFGFIAVGGGVNNLFGLTFSDIYTMPYAELEFGWFYIAGGAIFQLKVPDPNPEKAPGGFMQLFSETSANPYIAIGLDAPLFKLGPGKLGLDTHLGIITTDTPVLLVDDSGSFIGDLIGTIFASSIGGALSLLKCGATIYYTIIF